METFVNGSFFENTYLINNGTDAILIDPGEGLDKYLEEINKYNIKAILLTHAHIDHIDGIKYFKCPVYIYEGELEVLTNNDYNLYNEFNKKIPFDVKNLDLIILKDNEGFNLVGHKFKVISTPGHTKGSVIYLVDNKIMFSGDTLFQVGIGRTDFPTGDMNQMIESLRRLKTFDKDIKVYPGHGVETTISFELKYNEYLKNI